MKYTFLLIVRDTPGMLVRIAQVFARRGCNIRAIHVQPHQDTQWSTMTITALKVAHAKQMQHQLEKLVDVRSVSMQEQSS